MVLFTKLIYNIKYFPIFRFWKKGRGRTLLQMGANVHARDDGGLIPLHNACSLAMLRL